MRLFLIVGSISGALAVMLGAFGAHGLRDRVTPEALQIWQTAAHYHLLHSVMLVLVGTLTWQTKGLRAAGWLFLVGTVIFSGSLYLMVLTGAKLLGAITPLGGLSLISAWISLAVAATKQSKT